MSIIQFSFSNDKKILETSNALKLYILEREGYVPKAVAIFPKKEYSALELFESCEIKKDGKPFFIGRIEYIAIRGDEVHIELTSSLSDGEDDEAYKTDSAPEAELLAKFKLENPGMISLAKREQIYPPLAAGVSKPPGDSYLVDKPEEEFELLTKFKKDNPDLAVSFVQEQINRLGKKEKVSIFKPDAIPKKLDAEALYGSLTIEKSGEDSFSKVTLAVSASWVRRVEGDLDITSKIAKRFPAGKINTLTPMKLIDSWPKFGDRARNPLSSKQAKYFIGHSMLKIDGSLSTYMPAVEIIEDEPPLRLKKEFFDHKLSLFWGFEQFVSETINATITNSHIPRGVSKKLNVNLQNVQEYIEDIEEHSFFTSPIGNKIFSAVCEAVRNYVVLSMRRIKVSCELPFSKTTENLSCRDWIEIQGVKAKITKLEYNISAFEKTVKLVAHSFDIPIEEAEKSLDIPSVERPKRKEFLAGDIILDINVENDADAQYRKFIAYMREQKALGKINKSNYVRLAKSFFNENQTKINVVTKPLKTSHCEKFSIKAGNITI